MKNTPTPHKHAALIKEWADHLATGKVAAGWYKVQVYGIQPGWDIFDEPSWRNDKYRIIMTDKHPDYEPPVEMVNISFEMPKEEAIIQAKKLARGYYHTWVNATFNLEQLMHTAIKKALEQTK